MLQSQIRSPVNSAQPMTQILYVRELLYGRDSVVSRIRTLPTTVIMCCASLSFAREPMRGMVESRRSRQYFSCRMGLEFDS